MNLLFNLVLLINGQAYVIDHDMTASDCLAAIEVRYEAGLSPEYLKCEVVK